MIFELIVQGIFALRGKILAVENGKFTLTETVIVPEKSKEA
jgi:hypothetical protein